MRSGKGNVQNTSGTFSRGLNKGSFQGNALCSATPCFGGSAGILGQVLVRIAGPVDVPVPVDFIAANACLTCGASRYFENLFNSSETQFSA